jgi:hypothetical protein
MVLATETDAPMTTPPVKLHPRSFAVTIATPVMNKIPSGAPTRATYFTRIKSGMENSTPIENISRTTPTFGKHLKGVQLR